MPPINYKWHHQIVKFPQIYKKWFKMWFLTFLYIGFTFFTFFCYAALLQSFGWHIWCWYCFEHLKLWHLSRQMHCSNLGCKWSHGCWHWQMLRQLINITTALKKWHRFVSTLYYCRPIRLHVFMQYNNISSIVHAGSLSCCQGALGCLKRQSHC